MKKKIQKATFSTVSIVLESVRVDSMAIALII